MIKNKTYSVGIGLTNNCNLECDHCYRDKNNVSNISLDQIKTLCESIPVKSVGLGTGENLLNPEFYEIIDYLHKRGIKLSIASNGLTLSSISDDILALFSDVEVSIDFPTKELQDSFRGVGNWDLVNGVIERCKQAGKEITILSVMMSTNYNLMDKLVEHARKYQANLRVSAYQSVNSDKYHLKYDQFWEGYRNLLESSQLISCSEPVVKAVLGLEDSYSPCGQKSIRINPHGEVIPCVYWNHNDSIQKLLHISDLKELGINVFDTPLFKDFRRLSEDLSDCKCHGGCTSRRLLNGNLNVHDEYCPWIRRDNIKINWKKAPKVNLVRKNNNCTTIVK